jgi:PKD repeat protein
MKRLLLPLFALALPAAIMAQCSECTPDPSCSSPDGGPALCPEFLPDATAGEFYETSFTFFLPSTVDVGGGITATLNQVTITNVSGYPFGLQFQYNSPNGTYFPSQGQNYGCGTACGTPLIAGEYEIVVTVSIQATALGQNQSVVESFIMPLTVLPGSGGNASFTYDNLAACNSVTATFEASIDGSPGITTYSWNFGNGTSSDSANPPSQTYTEPGDYTVSLSTTIAYYTLTAINVTGVNGNWCGDVEEGWCGWPHAPDLYCVIKDGNGNQVFQTSTIDNSSSGTWNNLSIQLNNPPYSIEVWDEDVISANDLVGNLPVSLQTGTYSTSGGGASGNLTVALLVYNEFYDEEVVSVYPNPNGLFIVDPEEGILYYDDETLADFSWTLNGNFLISGEVPSVELIAPGVYQCTVTNQFGCTATSQTYTLCPEISLAYNAQFNVLGATPGFGPYSWTFNGLPLPDFTEATMLNPQPGNYSITISTNYGCTVTSNIVTVTVGISELSAGTMSAFPVPFFDQLTLSLPNNLVFSETISLFDLAGRVVLTENPNFASSLTLYASDLPAGVYIVRSLTTAGWVTSRVVKK